MRPGECPGSRTPLYGTTSSPPPMDWSRPPGASWCTVCRQGRGFAVGNLSVSLRVPSPYRGNLRATATPTVPPRACKPGAERSAHPSPWISKLLMHWRRLGSPWCSSVHSAPAARSAGTLSLDDAGEHGRRTRAPSSETLTLTRRNDSAVLGERDVRQT